ncbi:scabin-related ADP-ribosyltransferase [Winslowiella iniecta]|nr:hypothetical protein [Winslowiella iniecta]
MSKNIYLHALDNTAPPSNCINKSTNIKVAMIFASRDESTGFVYSMRKAAESIDINKVLGGKTPYAGESEIAIAGGVLPKDIPGVTPIRADGNFARFSIVNIFKGKYE